MMLRRLWNVFKIWLSVEEGETTTLSSILWTYSGVKKILQILSDKSLFSLKTLTMIWNWVFHQIFYLSFSLSFSPGAKTGKICDAGHDKVALYGRGKNYSRADAERLLRKLVIDAILHEDLQITAADTTACYIKLGPKANDVMMGRQKVHLTTCCDWKKNLFYMWIKK